MENETEAQVPATAEQVEQTATEETPLAIREDAVPARVITAERITDALPPAAYERIGQLMVTPEQSKELEAPTDPEEVDILPDGSIYLSHEYYRRKLNKVFGHLQWTLAPGSGLTQRPATNEWYQRWVLYVGGVYVSEAIASRAYQENNARMDLSDVAEAIKSDAIRRCCKDLGIGHECWNRRFQQQWRKEHAIQVVAKVWKRGQQINDKVWRRKDADPFPDEQTSARGAANPQPSPAPPAATAAPAPPKPAEAPPKAAAPAKPVQATPDAPKAAPTAAPAQPAAPAKAPTVPKLLDLQVRMAFAQARQAGLVVGENADPLMEILETEFKVARVVSDGKKSTELCHAMLKSLPGNLFTGLLKRMKEQAAQGAQDGNTPENI
jgi:hypothetical protein